MNLKNINTLTPKVIYTLAILSSIALLFLTLLNTGINNIVHPDTINKYFLILALLFCSVSLYSKKFIYSILFLLSLAIFEFVSVHDTSMQIEFDFRIIFLLIYIESMARLQNAEKKYNAIKKLKSVCKNTKTLIGDRFKPFSEEKGTNRLHYYGIDIIRQTKKLRTLFIILIILLIISLIIILPEYVIKEVDLPVKVLEIKGVDLYIAGFITLLFLLILIGLNKIITKIYGSIVVGEMEKRFLVNNTYREFLSPELPIPFTIYLLFIFAILILIPVMIFTDYNSISILSDAIIRFIYNNPNLNKANDFIIYMNNLLKDLNIWLKK
ncbi:MAG: hypothetical protein ACE5KT_03355 [Methanosarcinales archaeon]